MIKASPQQLSPLLGFPNYGVFPDAKSDKKTVDHYLIQLLDQCLLQYAYNEVLPARADKWLAVSSLHKSIRRGEVELAFRATASLLSVDPDYFFRRLPVIAYEDIGVADPVLCALVLFASAKRVQSAYGRDRLAYFLVERMAVSVKSRTATDVFCLTLSDPYAKSYIESCLRLPPARLVDIVLDEDLSLTHRIAAIRLITGYSVRQPNGFTKTVTKPNLDLLATICEETQVPPAISHLVVAGNGKTEGLNGSLLLAYEMFSNSTRMETIRAEKQNHHSHGVLHAALDQYCRAGRSVISEFVDGSRELQSFFAMNPVKNPSHLVGVLLFQIEGCAVDRQLNFDGMLELQTEVEKMELLQAGVRTMAAATSLRELLVSELDRLNSMQLKVLLARN